MAGYSKACVLVALASSVSAVRTLRRDDNTAALFADLSEPGPSCSSRTACRIQGLEGVCCPAAGARQPCCDASPAPLNTPLFLESPRNMYPSADKNGGLKLTYMDDNWEKWVMEIAGDDSHVFLRSRHGQYLSEGDGKEPRLTRERGDAERWSLIDEGERAVQLVSRGGRHLEDSSGRLRLRKNRERSTRWFVRVADPAPPADQTDPANVNVVLTMGNARTQCFRHGVPSQATHVRLPAGKYKVLFEESHMSWWTPPRFHAFGVHLAKSDAAQGGREQAQEFFKKHADVHWFTQGSELTQFELDRPSDIWMYVNDHPCWDNHGFQSVRIKSAALPEQAEPAQEPTEEPAGKPAGEPAGEPAAESPKSFRLLEQGKCVAFGTDPDGTTTTVELEDVGPSCASFEAQALADGSVRFLSGGRCLGSQLADNPFGKIGAQEREQLIESCDDVEADLAWVLRDGEWCSGEKEADDWCLTKG